MSCHSFVICHQSCVSMALDQNKMAFMDFLHPSVWLLVNRALLSCLHFCFGIYFLRKQRQQCSFLKGTLEHLRHPGTESLPNYINSYRCPLGFGQSIYASGNGGRCYSRDDRILISPSSYIYLFVFRNAVATKSYCGDARQHGKTVNYCKWTKAPAADVFHRSTVYIANTSPSTITIVSRRGKGLATRDYHNHSQWVDRSFIVGCIMAAR